MKLAFDKSIIESKKKKLQEISDILKSEFFLDWIALLIK